MKKRLFLSSAIMTAVLAGALTTGTFAWYNVASQGGKLTASLSEASVLETGSSTVTVGSQDITFTITPQADGESTPATLPVALTNGEGRIGGKASNGTIILQDPSTELVVNLYAVEADWTSLTSSADDTAIKQSLAGTYTFKLEAEGNVVLMANASSAADSNKDDYDTSAEGNDGFHKVIVTVDADGDISVTTGATGYYAIRTNNPYGSEVTTSSGAKAGTPVDGAAAYVDGQGYYYHESWHETPVHGLDKLVIKVVSGGTAAN